MNLFTSHCLAHYIGNPLYFVLIAVLIAILDSISSCRLTWGGLGGIKRVDYLTVYSPCFAVKELAGKECFGSLFRLPS